MPSDSERWNERPGTRRLVALLALLGAVSVLVVVAARRRGIGSPSEHDAQQPEDAAADSGPVSPPDAAESEGRNAIATQPPAPIDTARFDEFDTLHVIVRKSSGAPAAGVSVSLDFRLTDHDTGRRVAQATTDANGHASLVEAEFERERRERFLADANMEYAYLVKAEVPLPEAPTFELGEVSHSEHPIVLRLPPAGTLRVSATMPGDSSASEGGASVWWRANGDDGAFDRVGRPYAPLVDGVATLDPIPLGMELRVLVDCSGYRAGEALVVGPQRAGEVAVAEVRIGAPFPIASARLVDANGAPIGARQVAVALFTLPVDAANDATPDRPSCLWTNADDEGRLERVVRLQPREDERVVLLVHEEARHTDALVDRFGRADRTVELVDGEIVDFGIIELRPHADRRLLVTGRVTALEGELPPRVSVSAMANDPDSGRWSHLGEDRVEIARDGTFTLHTIDDVPDRFTVKAGARGYLGASAKATIGGHVELALELAGQLGGRFAASDPKALPHLAVRLRREGFSRSPNIALGAFEVDGLAPGVYSVSAEARSTDWTFATIEGVVVEKGERTLDPRLDPYDLGSSCRVLTLTISDDADEPLTKTQVWLAGDGQRGGTERTDETGRLVALVPENIGLVSLRARVGPQTLTGMWSTDVGYQGEVRLAPE